MAEIKTLTGRDGKISGYKIIVYLGRDEKNKKVRRSVTIERPEGLTPKREEKEVARIAGELELEQRSEYHKKEAKMKAEAREEKKKIKMPEFIEKWMKNVNNGVHTPDTVAFYSHMSDGVKDYFKTQKPNLKLVDIGKSDILDYISYLRHDAKTKSGRPYSDTTIRHYFSTLRNVLNYAVYIDYLDRNPCSALKAEDVPKQAEREIDFLDEDDAILFMESLESEKEKEHWRKVNQSYLQWKTLVNIMIVTGLRRGEVVGLQWRDIDRKQLVLSIRRNVTIDTANKDEKDPSKKIHVGELKGKHTRRVPITKNLLALLDELKKEAESKYKEISADDFIFCRADNTGLPMYPTEPTRQVRKFIKRHSLPDVSPHDLRHTAASLAIQSGANVKEIQKLLGHRDAATTLKFYTGITEKAERETIENIEGMLKKKEKKK